MSKLKLKRPLNQNAIRKADDEFYTQHPDMVENGKRIPLDPDNPRHASLRKEWRDNYISHGGEMEDDTSSSGKLGQIVTECPRTGDLVVQVTNCTTGEPLFQATVEIAGPQSRTVRTDHAGLAHFGNLPPGSYDVWGSKSGLQKNTTFVDIVENRLNRESLCLCPMDDEYWVHFKYVVKGTEYPVQDSASWTLVYPTGKTEQGQLQNGEIRRAGVPQGVYELQVQHLTGIQWGVKHAHATEEVEIRVTSKNIADGIPVEFRIFPQYQLDTTIPLATLSTQVTGDIACMSWRYTQELNCPPFGYFVALAKCGDKTAISDALVVEPFPIETDKGLQQRLKHLGYYAGNIDGIVGPQTKKAIRQFQEIHPPLIIDGIAGPRTRELLMLILY